MKRATDLVDNLIVKVEPDEEEKKHMSASAAALCLFRIKSLKLYRDTLNYLADEIIRTEVKNYKFLLPHLRTLFEVYGRFLHLLVKCSDDDQRALVCLTYQLYTAKNVADVGGNFKEVFDLNREFIQKMRPDFPKEAESLSRSWIAKNGLNFGSNAELLTQENIRRFSVETEKVFGTDKNYILYSHFSELLHGNPYYYNSAPYNERFWATALSLINTAFLIEVVDRYILNRGQSKDAREWLKEVADSRPEFIRLWQSRRQSA